MISGQLLNEERFSIAEPTKLGIKRSFSTLKRWHEIGMESPSGAIVQLEVLREGGQLVTSREAVKRFLAKLNGIELQG